VIDIHVGRQLFVDDFLIQQTTLSRAWHGPRYNPANPILVPDTWWEQEAPPGRNPTSMVFSDGVWHDPQDGLFKMWYMGGYCQSTCMATSHDGLSWAKPAFDVLPGSNVVLSPETRDTPLSAYRDSGTVLLDLHETDPARRFKLFLMTWKKASGEWSGDIRMSADGVHWSAVLGHPGPCGDRTTIFYNPFRRKWVFSLRYLRWLYGYAIRTRRYWETSDLLEFPSWANQEEPPFWWQADQLDPQRLDAYPYHELATSQLYNLDCVAYESVLLGLFSIWRGQPPDRSKYNSVYVGFSRDGFYWDRSNRSPFLPESGNLGEWNATNVQSAGGGCLVVGDQLYFYASGRAGISGSNATGLCTTGVATLRRDGFASMEAGAEPGWLTTRLVRFDGRFLFVNLETPQGELLVEILDEHGDVLAPWSAGNCVPLSVDSTCALVRWSCGYDIHTLSTAPVRFRFFLRHGRLFAFWVSRTLGGASRGYVAAGGPGFSNSVDDVGQNQAHLRAKGGPGQREVRLEFDTETGHAYTLQQTGSLPSGTWQDLVQVQGDGRTCAVSQTGSAPRFYRLKLD